MLSRVGFVITLATIFFLSAVNVHSQRARAKGIFDGWLAGRSQFKHHALISCALVDGSEIWKCNGAIISDRFVATSASCLRDCNNMKIRVGSTVHPFINTTDDTVYSPLYSTDDKNSTVYSAVYSTRPNPYYAPGYVPGFLKHNLALLETDKDIIYNEFVNEVLLPDDTDITVAANVTAMATGFGKQHSLNPWWELQYLRFKVLPHAECSRFFPNIMTANSSICANSTDYEDRQLRGGLCYEYGSPLVLKSNNRTLIGIFQNSRHCAEGGPDVFVNIGSYVGWIRKTAKLAYDIDEFVSFFNSQNLKN